MRKTTLVSVAVMLGVLACVPSAGAAARNPYTPREVCGSAFEVVAKKRLFPMHGRRIRLATVYLLYDRASGRSCVTTIKSRLLGRRTRTTAVVQRKGGAARSDAGYFQYYAGPVFVRARRRCVRYGAAVSMPGNRFRSFRSRYGWCRR